MTRVPVEEVAGPVPGRALRALAPIMLLLVVAILILVATTDVIGEGDVTWDKPEADSDVRDDLYVSVKVSANVTNVTFLYRTTLGDTVIDNGTFTDPDIYFVIWDTEDVSDGTYQLVANASLAGGGYATADVSDIRVDNTAPTAHFIAPQEDARLNGYHTIEVMTSTDAVSVEILIDVGNWFERLDYAENRTGPTNWTLTWNSTKYADAMANVSFMAVVTDAAGNEIRIIVGGIEIDNVPPWARLVYPVDNATLDAYVHLKGTTNETNIGDVYFEWRTREGEWEPIAEANWNEGMGYWMYQWNTYQVGEATGAEVRLTVVDDLGQRGYSSALNITITDLPPDPDFLTPTSGDHLTGIVDISVASQNDTVSVTLSYNDGTGWVDIGAADHVGTQVWNLTWDTSGLSLLETQLRANAFDATGNGSVALTGIEIDNTAPEPNIKIPGQYQYPLSGSVSLKVTSDRDTVSVVFHYLDGEEWVLFYQLVYNPNTDRWIGVWDIPPDLYIPESKICATATDEVGLTGTHVLDHREIGIPPGDIIPTFKSTMPETIFIEEDGMWLLELEEHISDNDKGTLKVYVTGEPLDLFYVDGENVTGNMDLRFFTLPDRHGEAQVKIIVFDPKGQSSETTLQVIITSVPDAPRFTDVPPNLFVRPDVPYTFNFLPYVDDVDSNLEDLSILLPDDEHVRKVPTNPLALVFSFGSGDLDKSFTVNITVRDDTGLISWLSIMVWVVDDWVPELRKPLPDIWMNEDEDKVAAFDLDSYFYDQDKDALYYSYGNRSVRVVIGNEAPHSVSIYPPKDWYGIDSVTFRATDPTGALLEDTIVIHCNSTNDPPYFVTSPRLPDLVIHHNVSYDFDLSPYVKDVDHELGELTIHTLDPGVTRSPIYTLGIRLVYPMVRSSFLVEIVIEDPEGASTEPRSLNVLVTDNHPPMLPSPPPDLVLVEGESRVQAFNVTSALDPDWLDGEGGTWLDLSFEFIGGPMTFSISTSGWVSVVLPDSDYNTYYGGSNHPVMVILRVKDAKGGFNEYLFSVTVMPVNDKPQVDPIDEIRISPITFTIDLRNYVRDVDTPFSQLKFEVKDAVDPDRVISYVSVHGWLLFMNYEGAESHVDRLNLIVIDYDQRVTAPLVVTVVAKEEEPAGFSMWIILAVVVVTGTVAVVASKFVWGRFEPPSVSDVFLVYGDGVIIRHLSKRGTMSMDEDLAIAMLTAIQEFVQQSMRSAQLKSMQAGENNILIERDPSRLFYIAVIHTGTVTEELRKAINFATRSIKEEYGATLEKWDGNIAKFEGVERYMDQILAISHAAIPEGVRFEMEGITSIEPGKTYMFQGKDVTRTHNIFRGLVEDHGSGLLISRVHPQRLHPSVPESGAECIWLSKTPTKRGVSPSNTTVILHEITTFVKDGGHPRTVVCLDGLEYLLVHNPLDEVVAFVSELTDMVQVDDFVMMIHVDPYALDDATLAKLSRNMVPVSDRTPTNGK